MPVKQLELDLWDVISTAKQIPEDANLPMVFELLDLALVDLDTRSQLRIAGEAVCQIANLFCDRSNLCFKQLLVYTNDDESVMFNHAFDCYVGQSVVADFEQFIQHLEYLSRRFHKRNRDNYIPNLTTAAKARIK